MRRASILSHRRGSCVAALAVVTMGGVLAVEGRAGADPLNSYNHPNQQDVADSQGAHNEFNLLPVAGGTTDIGIGGGYFLGYDRLSPGKQPYVWNVESAGFVTFAQGDSGKVIVPYQDFYLKATIPRFLVSTTVLEIRPACSWETTLHYYGLGNASSATRPPGTTDKYFEYGRLHPEFDVDLRWRILDHFVGRTGMRYIQNWFQIDQNSRLAEDRASGSPEVRRLLGEGTSSGVGLFNEGLQLDTRDNDTSTHSGVFASFDLQVSPGGIPAIPSRYVEGTADVRFFIPLSGHSVTLAGRAVGDVLYGDPPFYALATFEDTYAIGGLNGVRGVPGQRYYGKIKVLGNAELRTELATFHALGKPVTFGMVAFFDGGRVWADTTSQPGLDGQAVGLKYGVGGGLRLQSGSAFVIRADVAWSPDATPIGGYFAAGQMF